jgi:hypothetical protein
MICLKFCISLAMGDFLYARNMICRLNGVPVGV